MIPILFSIFCLTCWSKSITTTYLLSSELFFLDYAYDTDDLNDPPTYSTTQVRKIVNSLVFGVLKAEYNLDITIQPQKLARHKYKVTDSNGNELAIIQVLPGYSGLMEIEHTFIEYEKLEATLCLCIVSFKKLANIKGTLLFGQYDLYQNLELQKTITFKSDPFASNSKLTFKDKNGDTGTGVILTHDAEYMHFEFIWDYPPDIFCL